MSRKEERQMGRKAGIVVLALFLAFVSGLVGQGGGGLPELYLQKIVLEPPSPVARGEVVTIHTWVMNTGDRPASEFKVEFFYRPQGGESWTSFYVTTIPNLSPSRQHSLEIRDQGQAITLATGNLELGTYEVRVVADSNNQIPEEDETNNELVTALTILPSRIGLADLQPVALTFEPPSPTSDQLVVVSVEVRNTGDKDAGPFRVAFRVRTQEFDSTSLEGLAAGASVTVQGALDPYTLGLGSGSHNLSVIVDPDGQVGEQDEANNVLTASLTIQGAELRPTSLEFDRPLVRLDGRVTVSAKVVNVGKGKALTVEVGFYIDGQQFALANLGPLGPGEERVAQGELVLTRPELGLTTGVHEIKVVVDPNNIVPELDEANNVLTRPLTVLPPEPQLAELHPESLELNPPSPVELRTAEVVNVSSVLKNTGRATASGFSVEFSYRAKGRLRWEALPCRDQAGCSGLSLAPGAEMRVDGRLAIAGAAPGIYEIRVVVDPNGRVEELEETNNELITTLTLLAPRLPDLAFDPVSPVVIAPSYQVNRGQTLFITANAANVGDLDSGPFEVEFGFCRVPETVPVGLQAQPCTSPADFATFSVVSLSGLAVGNKAPAQVTLETSALQPGNYLILISIDPPGTGRPNGLVEEQSELNNILSVTVLIQGADLLPVSLELDPPSPVSQGQVVQVTAIVIDAGVEPVGKFDVNFYWCQVRDQTSCAREAEFVSFGGVSFPGIAVNNPEPASRELDTSALEPGDYLIRAVVDPDNRVSEQNESNNELFSTLKVEGPSEPAGAADLAPTSLKVRPSQILLRGQTAQVTVTIANLGQGQAGPFTVQFFYRPDPSGQVLFATKEISGLKAGETVTSQVSLATAALPYGDYTITVVVDPDDRVKESNEANNRMQIVMTLI